MISRRDFLLVRADRGGRAYDLCCERLYRQFVRSRVRAGFADEAESWAEVRRTRSEAGDGPLPLDDLFDRLERDLREVDVLRVADTTWLARTDLWQRLQPVLAAFRARGGRLEYSPAPLPVDDARR